jgi:hypothetical protein
MHPSEDQRFRLTVEGNEDNTDTNVLSSIDRTTTTGMKARDTQNRTRVSFAHEMDALDKGFADSLHWQLYTQHSETTQITDEDRANRSRRHREFNFDQRVYGLQAQFNKAFSTGSVEHALTYGFEARAPKSARSATAIRFWPMARPAPPSCPTPSRYAISRSARPPSWACTRRMKCAWPAASCRWCRACAWIATS